MKKILVVLLGLLLMANIATAAPNYGAKGAVQVAQPTVQEMLHFAIQDEYLARARYTAVLDVFGKIRPFSNIVQAEEQHIAYLRPLFNDRGWDVPADESGPYMIAPRSFAEALRIGEQAELDNIAMYEHFLRQADLPEDLQVVFGRLLASSQRHLAAFRR